MNLQEHILSKKTAAFGVQAKTWQEAVKAGTDLLESAGVVSPQYYEEILKSVAELGPYFVIAPGIAMPHARPEGGVLNNGFALVTLDEPVCFGDPDNDPIDILLTLAAVDAKTQNEEAIVQVVELFDNEDAIEQLKKVKSFEELEALFNSL